MPITPIDVLPVALTSFSLNLIHWPCLVTIIISIESLVTFTSISSSSSLKFIACRPDFLIFLYSLISVFLTNPFFVAVNKYVSSSNSLIVIIAVILSPGISWIRLIIAVPRAVLPLSGIS